MIPKYKIQNIKKLWQLLQQRHGHYWQIIFFLGYEFIVNNFKGIYKADDRDRGNTCLGSLGRKRNNPISYQAA
jgi:hypothetical protein